MASAVFSGCVAWVSIVSAEKWAKGHGYLFDKRLPKLAPGALHVYTFEKLLLLTYLTLK